ncbi:type II toxin-antitoxin system HicB family antitoxin [Endothiovibrio diazotrophicus]
MLTYIALIRKAEGSDYSVDFPDFPGCISAGRTLEEARKLALEALGFHVEGMLEDGEPLPSPSDLDAVMSQPENRGAVVFLASVTEPAAKSVRVNITLPQDVLNEIDEFARRRGYTRSGFIARAAHETIQREVG